MRAKAMFIGFFVTALLLIASTAAAATTVYPSGDLSGVADQANIKAALEAEKNGGTVVLAAGTFYLHKSVVVFEFDGTFMGSGKASTTVRTAPGIDFDLSEAIDVFRSSFGDIGAKMFLFPYHPDDEAKSFSMSDMNIIIDEPGVDPPLNGFVDDRRPYLLNTMHAVGVINVDIVPILLGQPFGTTNLDVTVRDVDIKGVQDPRFVGFDDQEPYDLDNSIGPALVIWGPSIQKAEASNMNILNADAAIEVSDHSTALIEDNNVQNAMLGIGNFFNPTIASDNTFLNIRWIPILLSSSPDSRIEANVISGDGIGPIIVGRSTRSVMSSNVITGDWVYGINPWGSSNECAIFGNYLVDMSSLFGTISIEQSEKCVVSGNKFVDVSGPSLGAVWVSGQFNRIEGNDYTESGLSGWNVGPGAIMLANYNGATFNRGSMKNYVFETQYPAGTNVCDQVQGIQGNNVQALVGGEVIGVNPGVCSRVIDLETFNQSNASVLQQMAEMQVQREKAWDRSRRPH